MEASVSRKPHGHGVPAGLLHGSVPYRSVECRPERDTLLPTGEGRLLPLCRSSIERLQGLDLSIEFSTLFSKLSKSNLKEIEMLELG